MSEATAQKVVLASVLVTGAVVAYDNIRKSGKASPGSKQLVTFAILAAGLMIAAGILPSIAGPAAILIALAVVVPRVGGVKK